MRFSLRALFLILALVGATLLIVKVIATGVRASVGYGVRASFARLPETDIALGQWLESQPGVLKSHVVREDGAIRINWIMSQDLTGKPSSPDLRANFEQFGYVGLAEYDENYIDH